MSEQTVDPVHGVRYEFDQAGDELLTVDSWMEDGGGLPKHYHPIQEEIWWVVDGEVLVTVTPAPPPRSWREILLDHAREGTAR